VGLPDSFRAAHRESISELVGRVVRDRHPLREAAAELGLPSNDADRLTELVRGDIARLGEHNFARYGLRQRELVKWIADGRPIN
jgi:hypothetical protein